MSINRTVPFTMAAFKALVPSLVAVKDPFVVETSMLIPAGTLAL